MCGCMNGGGGEDILRLVLCNWGVVTSPGLLRIADYGAKINNLG